MVWTLDLDARGDLTGTEVGGRRCAASRSTSTPTSRQRSPTLLAEVGERRLAIEVDRGGVRAERARAGGRPARARTWTVRYRMPLATEDHNAQVSLLTGMAAAQLMLKRKIGILRTQPPPDEKGLKRLRLRPPGARRSWRERPDVPRLHPLARPSDPPTPRSCRRRGRRPRRRLRRLRRGGARARRALRDRGAVRPRDGTAAPPAGPLRVECCLAAAQTPRCPTRSAPGSRPADVDGGGDPARRATPSSAPWSTSSRRPPRRPRGRGVRRGRHRRCGRAARAPRGARAARGRAPGPGIDTAVRLDRADVATRTVRFTSV